MWRMGMATSIFVAIVATVFLKALQVFKWISWHPTAFLKEGLDDAFMRWIILAALLFVVGFILYNVLQFLYKTPHYIVGLLLGVIVGVLLERRILDLAYDKASFKELSLPFLVVVVTSMLFIIETATFHRENLVNRNNLPYKKTVLK